MNQRHITEENLDTRSLRSSTSTNAYNQFNIPKLWGSGKDASADGTKWDLCEQNLLSEYHIRYGGYGGIGYYHVSDMYIALFSHFIPCGVWEAVHILDGLLKNKSDIQPDTLHADTQGQNAPVFGLAHLLAFSSCRASGTGRTSRCIDPTKRVAMNTSNTSAPCSPIRWTLGLIRTHLADMLRVAVSIKTGRISASTASTTPAPPWDIQPEEQAVPLYRAFRELGRVIRTGVLLRYLADKELRATIQAATNKSEQLNYFLKWVFFGGEEVITENSRDEQRGRQLLDLP